MKELVYKPKMPMPLRVEVHEDYEVFHQQKKEYLRYLILGKYAYNSKFVLSTDHPDIPSLQRALRTLFARHESLRTRFLRKEGEIRQVIYDADSLSIEVGYLDLSAEPNKQELADRLLEECSSRCFDFEEEFMCEIKLIRFQPYSYHLLFTTHHIICDAVSIRILRRELGLLYEAYLQGRGNPLPPLTMQYKDYAFWANRCLEGRYAREAKAFYDATVGRSLAEESTEGAVVPGLAASRRSVYKKGLREDLIRAKGPSGPELFPEAFGCIVNLYPEKGGYYKTYLEGSLVTRLKKATHEKRATFFGVLLTAFSLLLSSANRLKTARIYVPHTTRLFEEFENIVGWLTSEVIVCIPFDPAMQLDRMLGKVAVILQEASDHCVYPYEMILNDMDISLSVLAHGVLNYMVNTDSEMPRFEPCHSDKGSGHFNLECKVTEYSDGMTIEMNYNVHAYERDQVAELAARFGRILEGFVHNRLICD